MKKQWAELLLTLILGIGAPWLILGTGAALLQRQEPTQETIVLNQPASHRIQVLTENGEQQLQLEEYLTGVLLRELPASFAMEAKKAQAIVARTYAMRVTAGSKHDGCVCTDSGCCQGYWDPEDYLESGGKLSAVEEAREAAVQTVDTVLTYDGELIDATYGRRTRAVLIMDSGHVILSAILPETIAGRMSGKAESPEVSGNEA